MNVSQNIFVPICCFAAVLSMVFIAQIVTGHPSSSGAAAAQPSAPIAPVTTYIQGLAVPEESILCSSPFNLNEAHVAMYDEKWLKSLDCVRVKSRLPATVLECPLYIGCKMRVTLPNGEGFTVWASKYPTEYCGDIPCPSSPPSPSPEHGSLSKPLKPAVKRETGTSARWVCQKTTIVNRNGSSPTTCGFQTLPEDAK